MAQLITAEEIIELAFMDDDFDEDNLKDLFIEVTQEAHIRPVLGDDPDQGESLYDEIVTQNNNNNIGADNRILLEQFIRPALAFFCKYEILEEVSIKITNQGAQSNFTEFGRDATNQHRSDLSKKIYSHAQTLSKKMTRFLEANETKYPLYSSSMNVDRTSNIIGGIVLGAGLPDAPLRPEDDPIDHHHH